MITIILIITHLILDFTFQSSVMAQEKGRNFKYLFVHSLIYMIGCDIICSFLFTAKFAFFAAAVLSISHFVIDWIRQRLELKFSDNTFKFFAFVLDQIIHIAITIAVSALFDLNTHTSCLYQRISGYTYTKNVILYIFLFVVIWDPASVFIKKIFESISSNNSSANADDLKMGNLIGKLERVIVTVLVLLNQYGVIGLVLTAKSIARFKQLEDKNFAEKYLVGTLASLSIALIAAIITKNFL